MVVGVVKVTTLNLPLQNGEGLVVEAIMSIVLMKNVRELINKVILAEIYSLMLLDRCSKKRLQVVEARVEEVKILYLLEVEMVVMQF